MHQEMRTAMESAGFRLQNEHEPGIYVRGAEKIRVDALDWQSEPTELLHQVQIHIKRYRAQAPA